MQIQNTKFNNQIMFGSKRSTPVAIPSRNLIQVLRESENPQNKVNSSVAVKIGNFFKKIATGIKNFFIYRSNKIIDK